MLNDGTGGTILKWSNGLIFNYGHCSDNSKYLLELIDDYNNRMIGNVT